MKGLGLGMLVGGVTCRAWDKRIGVTEARVNAQTAFEVSCPAFFGPKAMFNSQFRA